MGLQPNGREHDDQQHDVDEARLVEEVEPQYGLTDPDGDCTLKAEGAKKTRISVERTVFKRERILWVDKDEPATSADQAVEKDVLAAIRKSL